MSTNLATLFMAVEAMSPEAAQRRWDELLASAANVDGYVGLTPWQADELQLIADKLGHRVTWRHMNLTTQEIEDGRSPD